MKAGRGRGHRALIPSYATTTLATSVPASSDDAQAAVPRDQVSQGSLAPSGCAASDHPDEIAIWIDWCCLDQDAPPSRHKDDWTRNERRQMGKLIASCDMVLTPVLDGAPDAWEYPAVWTSLLAEYRAECESWAKHFEKQAATVKLFRDEIDVA